MVSSSLTPHSASPATSSAISISPNDFQTALIELLKIDCKLVDNKKADIQVIFEKYVATQSAYDKIRSIDWQARGYHKPPIKHDIVAIFIGKSQYHGQWDPIFKKLFNIGLE